MFFPLGLNWALDILAEEFTEKQLDPPPHEEAAR